MCQQTIRQRKGLKSVRTRADEQRSQDKFLLGLTVLTLIVAIVAAVFG